MVYLGGCGEQRRIEYPAGQRTGSFVYWTGSDIRVQNYDARRFLAAGQHGRPGAQGTRHGQFAVCGDKNRSNHRPGDDTGTALGHRPCQRRSFIGPDGRRSGKCEGSGAGEVEDQLHAHFSIVRHNRAGRGLDGPPESFE
ncbi:hypothetical protein BMS3Abin05_00004 [bacterium BMS3Abin05]|nr:hypothetical protein BMS3Abin05_00004 [bacterium BMS3Abin05]